LTNRIKYDIMYIVRNTTTETLKEMLL